VAARFPFHAMVASTIQKKRESASEINKVGRGEVGPYPMNPCGDTLLIMRLALSIGGSRRTA